MVAVGEEADALGALAAFLVDLQVEMFAGQGIRPYGLGKGVEVEDANVLDAGDAVEVEIVGEKGGAAHAGDGEEFCIDVQLFGVRLTPGVFVDDEGANTAVGLDAG